MNDAELREMAWEFLETWERDWNKLWREQLEPDLAALLQRIRDETRAERDGEIKHLKAKLAKQDRLDNALDPNYAPRRVPRG